MIRTTEVPRDSEIGKHLAGAHLFDAYEVPTDGSKRSALEIYVDIMARTPAWINCLMAARNRTVGLFGLRHVSLRQIRVGSAEVPPQYAEMDPYTFQFEVTAEGIAQPGFGVIAAYVPAAEGWPAVVVLASDPGHDPGRPIETMVPAAIQYVIARTGFTEANLRCVAIDALGHFAKAVPHWGGSPTPVIAGIEFELFESGNGVDAYLAETGAAGEVALEMLSSVGEPSITLEETPTALEFLNAIESHGNLPVPSAIFRKVERAVAERDARIVAKLLQSDPVIATSLINYSNAAKFAGDSKT